MIDLNQDAAALILGHAPPQAGVSGHLPEPPLRPPQGQCAMQTESGGLSMSSMTCDSRLGMGTFVGRR